MGSMGRPASGLGGRDCLVNLEPPQLRYHDAIRTLRQYRRGGRIAWFEKSPAPACAQRGDQLRIPATHTEIAMRRSHSEIEQHRFPVAAPERAFIGPDFLDAAPAPLVAEGPGRPETECNTLGPAGAAARQGLEGEWKRVLGQVDRDTAPRRHGKSAVIRDIQFYRLCAVADEFRDGAGRAHAPAAGMIVQEPVKQDARVLKGMVSHPHGLPDARVTGDPFQHPQWNSRGPSVRPRDNPAAAACPEDSRRCVHYGPSAPRQRLRSIRPWCRFPGPAT